MVCDANFVTQMWPTGPQQMCHPLQFLSCHVVLRLLPSHTRVDRKFWKPSVSMIDSKVRKSLFYTSHTAEWQDSVLAILTSSPQMATGCMQVSSAQASSLQQIRVIPRLKCLWSNWLFFFFLFYAQSPRLCAF